MIVAIEPQHIDGACMQGWTCMRWDVKVVQHEGGSGLSFPSRSCLNFCSVFAIVGQKSAPQNLDL